MHKPVWFLKGNNPILLLMSRYNFLHMGVQGGATSFILSGFDFKLLFAKILMSETIMRKSDMKIGMIPQKSEWLASLKYDSHRSKGHDETVQQKLHLAYMLKITAPLDTVC